VPEKAYGGKTHHAYLLLFGLSSLARLVALAGLARVHSFSHDESEADETEPATLEFPHTSTERPARRAA